MNLTESTNWSDSEWDNFKNCLVDELKQKVVTVSFTKKDGTERIMKCTLDPSILPKSHVSEDKEPKKKNSNTIAVYDVEANAWRSFVVRNVNQINS